MFHRLTKILLQFRSVDFFLNLKHSFLCFCNKSVIVYVFSFGQSRSLFEVGPSLVSIEIGEENIFSSLKKRAEKGVACTVTIDTDYS